MREAAAGLVLVGILLGCNQAGEPVAAPVTSTGSPTGSSSPYPSLLGAWTGTLTIADTNGVVGNVCTHSWNITSQSGGTVSGTALSAGTCRTTSGVVSGTVSTSGALSLAPNILALDASCNTRLSGGTFTGTASATSVSATTIETIRCPNLSPPYQFTRTITLALQR